MQGFGILTTIFKIQTGEVKRLKAELSNYQNLRKP
jgi:hypothetical protein